MKPVFAVLVLVLCSACLADTADDSPGLEALRRRNRGWRQPNGDIYRKRENSNGLNHVPRNTQHSKPIKTLLLNASTEQVATGKREHLSYDDFITGERGHPSFNKFIAGKRGHPSFDEFIAGKRGHPSFDEFIAGKRGHPSFDEFIAGKRGHPSFGELIAGKRGQPSFDEFIAGKRGHSSFDEFTAGKRGHPSFDEFIAGKRGHPSFDEFIAGKRGHPSFGEFIAGKRGQPSFDEFIAGKRGHPSFDEFISGKRGHPSFDEFIAGKRGFTVVNSGDSYHNEIVTRKRGQSQVDKVIANNRGNPSYEEFVTGKRMHPSYGKFVTGAKGSPSPDKRGRVKRGTPSYNEFITGKRGHSLNDNFIARKRGHSLLEKCIARSTDEKRGHSTYKVCVTGMKRHPMLKKRKNEHQTPKHPDTDRRGGFLFVNWVPSKRTHPSFPWQIAENVISSSGETNVEGDDPYDDLLDVDGASRQTSSDEARDIKYMLMSEAHRLPTRIRQLLMKPTVRQSAKPISFRDADSTQLSNGFGQPSANPRVENPFRLKVVDGLPYRSYYMSLMHGAQAKPEFHEFVIGKRTARIARGPSFPDRGMRNG